MAAGSSLGQGHNRSERCSDMHALVNIESDKGPKESVTELKLSNLTWCAGVEGWQSKMSCWKC